MTNNLDKIVATLKGMRGKPAPNAPKGMPKSPTNSDGSAPDGVYRNEELLDPGYNHNGVTGTGNGPVIG